MPAATPEGASRASRASRADDPNERRRAVIATYAVSIAVQAVMVVIGLSFVVTDDTATSLAALVLWCGLGTVYAVTALIALGVVSRRKRAFTGRPSRLELSLLARVISFIGTFSASLVGLIAAFQLLTLRSDPDYGPLFAVVGVWAMLVSWGFLHWGFVQIYQQLYFVSEVPPLRFPSTPNPGVIEFVYFSYTLGTSFAASDIEVQSTRMRWRVVWHSVLSFFFNGLIVVFALNTILSFGGAGAH